MSRKHRLLILNPTCLDVVDGQREYLDSQPIDWIADNGFRKLAWEDVDNVLNQADGLILPASLRTLPHAEHMERHRSIKVLSIAASGYDWLDVKSATANGIVVTNAIVPEGSEVVADLTWGLLLAVARQIPQHDRQVRAGCYDRGMGTCVWRKTLGIIGLGQIGRAVARRARGFDMSILAHEPHPDRDFVKTHGVELTSLEDVLGRSDFVSLHVRLDDRTRGVIGARELRLMKPSAYLINAARAQLVNEADLVEAIATGTIAGAGLDDPPSTPECPLTRSASVVYTPHLGNRAVEGMNAVFRRAIDHAVAVLEGRRPASIVNPEVYAGPCRPGRP